MTGDMFPSANFGLNSANRPRRIRERRPGDAHDRRQNRLPISEGHGADGTGTYGYQATPLATQATGASYHTLVSGPGSSALVGIYTHPTGVQEMVETFDQNQDQLQSELLRHGAMNWVTRGVYFGDQRNYLETDIDDNFTAR